MELMAYNVSKRIQFWLIKFVMGVAFDVWVMMSPTCSDCDPVWVLAVYDGQFST